MCTVENITANTMVKSKFKEVYMNYELPKKYWEERDPKTKKVEPKKLLNIIEDYIAKHNVMALATSHDNIVRNTPVEYIYWNDAFYFLSEGGKKFDGLEVNTNVCLTHNFQSIITLKKIFYKKYLY